MDAKIKHAELVKMQSKGDLKMENLNYTDMEKCAQKADELYTMIQSMPYSEIICERDYEVSDNLILIERAAKSLTEFVKFIKRQNRSAKK